MRNPGEAGDSAKRMGSLWHLLRLRGYVRRRAICIQFGDSRIGSTRLRLWKRQDGPQRV